MNPKGTDVAIIGLGAGGGVAAYVLTRAGLDVVGLEAGPRLDRAMMTLDEIRNDIRTWLSDPKSKGEMPTWRLDGTHPVPMLMVNAVGGTTVHYNASSDRFQPWQFQSKTRTIERYGAAAIPEDSTLTDWPIRYEDIEAYYDAVEYAIGVSGLAGNLQGELMPGGNPFEGARSRAYPMPPLRASGWNDIMSDAASNLGWHPFPVPSAVHSQPYNGNPGCTYCGYCRLNGCYRDAKGSTDVTMIGSAEATGRLRVETRARAVRIEVDSRGLVRGVTYVQDGREQFQAASVVLVAGFVYENTRLLLLSKSSGFPNGLSNNHGQVGKHFMAHLTPHAYGLFTGRKLNRFNGAGGQIICLDDWNEDNFDHSGLGFVGGALFMAQHEFHPIQAASGQLPAGGVARWGSGWKDWIGKNANSIGHANADLENLPYEDNFLDLDPQANDPYGIPLVRVTHRLGMNERLGLEFMTEKLSTWLKAAGATEVWHPQGTSFEGRHPYGGTRMGTNPESSVVDRFGFSHEVPNLGILGASIFPTTGGHNPTLTLQALSWMTAEHAANNWEIRVRGLST